MNATCLDRFTIGDLLCLCDVFGALITPQTQTFVVVVVGGGGGGGGGGGFLI